jgi:hypothetical protein
MATKERDIFAAEFTVGDYVLVRCLVTAITPVQAGPSNYGGSGDFVSLTVETPNANDKAGVTLVVSPQQCRKAGNKDQA